MSARDRIPLKLNVYEAALKRIEILYDQFDRVIVMFSGGKDSTAVLYCAIEVAQKLDKLPVEAIYVDHEIEGQGTLKMLRDVEAMPEVELKRFCLPFRCRNAASTAYPYWYPWHPAEKDIWANELPENAITELDGFVFDYDPDYEHPDGLPFKAGGVKQDMSFQEVCQLYEKNLRQQGFTVVSLIGLRAQESFARYQALTAANEAYLTGYAAYPIYDWQATDVWKLVKENGKPYNTEYDTDNRTRLYNQLNKQRVGSVFAEESLRGLDLLPEKYGEYWHKILLRAEGVQTARMYNNDGIYTGTKVEKEDGITWRQYCKSVVDRTPPKMKKWVTSNINAMIRHHKSVTDYPIADTDAQSNPLTGISWEALAKIAIRGDVHGRTKAQQTMLRVKAQKRVGMSYEEAIHKYANREFKDKYYGKKAARRKGDAT